MKGRLSFIGKYSTIILKGISLMTDFGPLIFLVILIAILLALGLLAWFLISSSKPKTPTANRPKPAAAKTDAKANVATDPVVQRFVSNDLKKRAFVVRQNEGGFKVIFEQYSTQVINRSGEVAGWQTQPEKPVAESLASAVEIAQSWVHAQD
jgi:cytoskeletal protein RodZ